MDPDHPSPVRDASVHTAARGTNKSLAFQKDSVSWIGHNIKTGVPGFFFLFLFFLIKNPPRPYRGAGVGAHEVLQQDGKHLCHQLLGA